MAAGMAERWHTRLTELLSHNLQGEQPLILSDSGRMSPLFVGFPAFVRGYDIYSFDPHDCNPGACIRLLRRRHGLAGR